VVAFDRRTNVGLHHLALAVADRVGLDALYERVASWRGVVVEFAPELSGKGEARRRGDREMGQGHQGGQHQGGITVIPRIPEPNLYIELCETESSRHLAWRGLLWVVPDRTCP
jgi:hypothetical protein